MRENLTWIEIPMVHPEGRCLKLNFTMTLFTETTIILKFHDIKDFNGSLEITITGWTVFKIWKHTTIYMFLDPYREYYKPDIFTFGGDKVRMDFNIAGQSVNKTKICEQLFLKSLGRKSFWRV